MAVPTVRVAQPLHPSAKRLQIGLLNVDFPGRSVTFLGSLIGFVYALVLGYATSRTVTVIYNRLTVDAVR